MIALIAAGGLAASPLDGSPDCCSPSPPQSVTNLLKIHLHEGYQRRRTSCLRPVSPWRGRSRLATLSGGSIRPGFAALGRWRWPSVLAAATLFPVLMMGIFSMKMNTEGAVSGMLAGLIATLLYIFTYLGWFFIPGTNMLANTPDNWLFGISPLFPSVSGRLPSSTSPAWPNRPVMQPCTREPAGRRPESWSTTITLAARG